MTSHRRDFWNPEFWASYLVWLTTLAIVWAWIVWGK